MFVLAVVVISLSSEYAISNDCGDGPRKNITTRELNNCYRILGLFNLPVGTLHTFTGQMTEISAKPGKYFQIKTLDGRPSGESVAAYLIVGKIPEPATENELILFRGTIELRRAEQLPPGPNGATNYESYIRFADDPNSTNANQVGDIEQF